MERGDSFWDTSWPRSPLRQLRIKAPFLFFVNSVSVIFIQLQFPEKTKILANIRITKMDTDELKQRFNAALSKVGWDKGTPFWSPNIKDPKQVFSVYPSIV